MILESAVIGTFMSGAIATAHFVACLFFMRFWKRTRDRLFLFFASAFALLLLMRVLLTLTTPFREDNVLLYTVRLLAFLIMLAAIVDKNRARG